MSGKILTMAGGVATSLAAIGHAAESKPIVLESSAPWTLDFADERCSLIRHFGNESDGVTLQIDSFGSPRDFRVLITGKPVPHALTPTSYLHYSFSSDDGERDAEKGLFGTSGKSATAASFPLTFLPPSKILKNRPDFIWDLENPPHEPPDFAKFNAQIQEISEDFASHVKSLTVDLPRAVPIVLQTGNMAKPLEGMQLCIDDLIKSWGVDPAVYRAETRPATPLAATIHTIQDNYPSKMMINGINAYVSVRVMVDDKGKATKCVAQTTTADQGLTKTLCSGFERGFKPALDSQGNPIATVYIANVFYLIEG